MKTLRTFIIGVLLGALTLATPQAQDSIIRLTGDGWLVGAGNNVPLLLGANGKGFLKISETGAITFINSAAGTFLAADGSSAAPSYSFVSRTDTGLKSDSGGAFDAVAAGTNIMRFLSTTGAIINGGRSLAFGSSDVGTPDVFLGRVGSGQLVLSTAVSGGGSGVCISFASDNNLNVFDRACTTRVNVVAALFNGRQPTLGSNVNSFSTDATNDDPTETLSQQRITTTDATVTTLQTITIATSTNTVIGCFVTARRTGGAAGAAEDGAGYYLEVVMKNTAGTAAELAAETVRTIGESQAGWNVTSAPSGATELIQVTGAASNNVTWHSSCRTWPVST